MLTEIKHVETTIRGRYIVRPGGESVVAGFHGYAETAEEQLARIEAGDAWTIVSIQALHPFYRRGRDVVASWMTRLDRDLAIADNVAYVRRVLGDFSPRRLVFCGFSQGGAMAYRAAARLGGDGLIVLGSDVPPDIRDVASLPPLLLGRGLHDPSYTGETLAEDLKFLNRVTRVDVCEFEGGHEWTDDFRAAARDFLHRLA